MFFADCGLWMEGEVRIESGELRIENWKDGILYDILISGLVDGLYIWTCIYLGFWI